MFVREPDSEWICKYVICIASNGCVCVYHVRIGGSQMSRCSYRTEQNRIGLIWQTAGCKADDTNSSYETTDDVIAVCLSVCVSLEYWRARDEEDAPS